MPPDDDRDLDDELVDQLTDEIMGEISDAWAPRREEMARRIAEEWLRDHAPDQLGG